MNIKKIFFIFTLMSFQTFFPEIQCKNFNDFINFILNKIRGKSISCKIKENDTKEIATKEIAVKILDTLWYIDYTTISIVFNDDLNKLYEIIETSNKLIGINSAKKAMSLAKELYSIGGEVYSTEKKIKELYYNFSNNINQIDALDNKLKNLHIEAENKLKNIISTLC
jgi:hypothetical protein